MTKKKTTKKVLSLEGLDQKFKNVSTGKEYILKNILSQNDWWALKGKDSNAIIMTHNAIKKIADLAGIRKDCDYSVLIQPAVTNNYQQTWQVRICDEAGKCTTEIGESNRGNLGARGRNNPSNMAQKRAWDRAVLRHLELTGFLGEDELPDNDETQNMNKLSPDSLKAIAPHINEIINAKTKADLNEFKRKAATLKAQLEPDQVDYLRKLWAKQMQSFTKSF